MDNNSIMTENGMTLFVPANDYKQPTEARQAVVQAIIYAFLTDNTYCKVYHPHDWFSREPKLYEAHNHISTTSPLFCGCWRKSEDFVRMRGCEMAMAFKALRSAGYHMFRVVTDGGWKGYLCHKKPFFPGGVEVEEFTDFID